MYEIKGKKEMIQCNNVITEPNAFRKNNCIREVREHAFKERILNELEYGYRYYKVIGEDRFKCPHFDSYKYDTLHKEVIGIKEFINKLIGNNSKNNTLRMNWRELQYRNKLTKLLGVSQVSSWDIIYNKVKELKNSSTNS